MANEEVLANVVNSLLPNGYETPIIGSTQQTKKEEPVVLKIPLTPNSSKTMEMQPQAGSPPVSVNLATEQQQQSPTATAVPQSPVSSVVSPSSPASTSSPKAASPPLGQVIYENLLKKNDLAGGTEPATLLHILSNSADNIHFKSFIDSLIHKENLGIKNNDLVDSITDQFTAPPFLPITRSVGKKALITRLESEFFKNNQKRLEQFLTPLYLRLFLHSPFNATALRLHGNDKYNLFTTPRFHVLETPSGKKHIHVIQGLVPNDHEIPYIDYKILHALGSLHWRTHAHNRVSTLLDGPSPYGNAGLTETPYNFLANNLNKYNINPSIIHNLPEMKYYVQMANPDIPWADIYSKPEAFMEGMQKLRAKPEKYKRAAIHVILGDVFAHALARNALNPPVQPTDTLVRPAIGHLAAIEKQENLLPRQLMYDLVGPKGPLTNFLAPFFTTAAV